MQYSDIFVSATVTDVQQWLAYTFTQQGFKLEWTDQYNGRATRGSAGANVAFGAMSQFYAVDFQLFSSPDGGLGIRLYKGNSGWAGGAIGAHKVKKQYGQIVDSVTQCFESLGCFRGRDPV